MTTATLELPAEAEVCQRCAVGIFFPDGRRRCSLHSTETDDQLVEALDARAPGIGLSRTPARIRTSAPWPGSYSWPVGPHVDVAARGRLLDWAEAQGLRRSTRSHPCLRWLRTRQSCRRGCWDSCWADLRGRTKTKAPAPTVVVEATPEQAADLRVHPGTRLLQENPEWWAWFDRPQPEHDPETLDAVSWLDHTSAWVRDGQPAVVVAQPHILSPVALETLGRLDQDSQLRVTVDQSGSWYGHSTWFVGVWRTAG